MAEIHNSIRLLLLLLLLSFSPCSHSATFTLTNQCSYTIWPGFLSGAGTPSLSTTGFALNSGESNSVSVPASWSGRVWSRTLCSNGSDDKFSCLTGDCGSGNVECAGAGAAPPTTLAEFTLNGAGGLDFYDVSLVDGYNLPMLLTARGGTGGNCTSTGCVAELNGACPSELRVTSEGGSEVACKSACDAFGDPRYCCSGAYASPDACKPTSYSMFFKNGCPRAYSYAYDDATSTFTCAGADYAITFCPKPKPSVSVKTSNGGQFPAAGAIEITGSSSPKATSSRPTVLFLVVVAPVALLL